MKLYYFLLFLLSLLIKESNSDSSINYYIKIAKEIKRNLAEKLGVWNVIVGSDYGSYISYDKGYLIFFRIREINILIFRYGIEEQSGKTKDN